MQLLSKAITFATVWSKVWPILVAILFFGLIILIHELGHFAFAKIFKVKVNEFALGMGPTILRKKTSQTQYSLRLFPIGGFVSMEGEDEGSEDENAFCRKKVWQRFIICLAGAVMNLLLGLLFVCILTSMGELVGTTQIHSFYPNARSQQTGLQAGDEIKKINGTAIFSSRDIDYSLIRDQDGVYDIVVKRNGEKKELKNVTLDTQKDENGRQTIIFDFILVGKEKTFLNCLTTSVMDSISIARLVWLSLFDLVTGRYGLNDLSGPIGTVKIIANITSDAAKSADLSQVIYVMALISINIGVFNLLPIPALDGGKLFFLIIEGIRRKPIPQKYEGMINAVCFALLMIFMVVVSFSDIKNLIQGVI